MVWKARIWLYPQYEIQDLIDLHAKKGPASPAAAFCRWLEKAVGVASPRNCNDDQLVPHGLGFGIAKLAGYIGIS